MWWSYKQNTPQSSFTRVTCQKGLAWRHGEHTFHTQSETESNTDTDRRNWSFHLTSTHSFDDFAHHFLTHNWPPSQTERLAARADGVEWALAARGSTGLSSTVRLVRCGALQPPACHNSVSHWTSYILYSNVILSQKRNNNVFYFYYDIAFM